MKPKILIIEDESKYAYILEKYFSMEGFEICLAFDGINGVRLFKEFSPDIICLDIMLPQMNGYEVAEKIRKESDVPIIMMSALSEEGDILKGYTLHIDDYITKPFRIPILIAKVKNLLKRKEDLIKSLTTSQDNELVIGGIRIVRNSLQCFVNGENVKLTKTEFKLLEHLMDNKGKNCTREQLLSAFWEEKDVEERIVDTYIKKIRRIVLLGNCEIVTAFGIGYRFEEKQ